MRGIVLWGETLGSHLLCPACRRHIVSDGLLNNKNGSRLVSFRDPPRPRTFTTKTEVPTQVDPLEKPKWAAPRFARSRIPKTSSTTTSVLEGGWRESQPQKQGGNENGRSDQEPSRREAAFYRIIRDGQPEQVMNALLNSRYHGLVGSLPSSTFVEAFHILSPAYFIEPYRAIHRPLHPVAVSVKGYKLLESIFDDFANKLATIVQIRRKAGHVLGLAEYTHLLDCARSMGDAQMADLIWEDMEDDAVMPDVQCYNHYMEANVWDNAYTGREKYHLRVTPFYYRKRRFENPNPGWQGYGTAGRSVRRETLRIFKDMTARGIDGDEASFVNVFLAASRVGHRRGMKNILMTVWNIGVDLLLMENDDGKIPQATFYEPSSPLYPSARLLFAVAHGFGTNSDMPAALRVVDFMSRTYNIAVPENVWLELFERAFVLSRQRFGNDATRNAMGSVSYDLLTTMFEMMTSTPCKVRPTIEVYHMLAKSAWDRATLSEFQFYMNAAYELVKETRQKRKTVRLILEEYLDQHLAAVSKRQKNRPESLLQSRAFLDTVNSYDILRLMTAQQTIVFEHLARLLLIHHRWTGRDNSVWEYHLLPRAIEEWGRP